MGLPPDSIVAFTLSRMQSSLARRTSENDVASERSGLLFLGNVHDAFPRRLFMDTRLSPLDKTAWVMIRLYAQQNEGAIFPTYDELQLQLASPHAEKASRETISRALLMLRITGWLSLCKRVRDTMGRVRGNIYAQHDEPLSCRDAETFDPSWLDLVASSCEHKNKSVRMTALAVLEEIRNDPTMRHRHSRISLIENRLGTAATPHQMAVLRSDLKPSSNLELGDKNSQETSELLSSNSELSINKPTVLLSSNSELSGKSASYHEVRKSNRNVRNFTQGINKKTYVSDGTSVNGVSGLVLPESLLSRISLDDAAMLTNQLGALPEPQSFALLDMLKSQLKRGHLTNPMGWLLAMLKRARDGQMVMTEAAIPAAKPSRPQVNSAAVVTNSLPVERASNEQVASVIADIKSKIFRK